MAGKVFISYRRDDVKADAQNIYNTLVDKYGTAGVFMDVRDLSGGHVFDEVILDAVTIRRAVGSHRPELDEPVVHTDGCGRQ